MTHGTLNLAALPFYAKVLITGFLVVIGSGYLAAALNARLAVGVSPAAIADHYGDSSLSTAERAAIEAQGFVEEAFSLDDEAPAMDHDGHGAHDQSSPASAEAHALSLQDMAELAHIHWLGFSFILLCVGGLACVTAMSNRAKTALVLALFLSLWLDIASLFLVRFLSGGFAWLTMVTGTAVGLCLLIVALRVLWELWWTPVGRGPEEG